jgi:hypothetical protein
MKRTLSLVLLLALVTPAVAQDCLVGVYGDADARYTWFSIPEFLTPFSFYVVMRIEGRVNAVAYRLEIPDLFDPQTNPLGEMFLMNSYFGPQEDGIDIATPGGSNVGLGECAVGFGDLPVVVARYEVIVSDHYWPSGPIRIHPNVDENPDAIAYSDCRGNVLPCASGGPLYVEVPDLATESSSWGAVKSLY